MKAVLIALSFACLVGGLQGIPLDHDLDDETVVEEFSAFVEAERQVLPDSQDETLPRWPTPRPTPKPSTTPSPPAPTAKPTRPPQIHHNAFRSQGPLAGRLINVVQNQDGEQKTVQRNKIQFNYLLSQSIKKMLEESIGNNDA